MELNEQYYRELEIPKSEEVFYFEHNVYDNTKLGNYITKENFDYILTEAEKIVCDCTVKKDNYDKVTLGIWIYILGIISLISFILYCIILYYGPRYKNGNTLYLISIGFGLFAIFIILILLLYNLFKRITLKKTIDDLIYDYLTQYFETIKNQLSEYISFRYDKKKKALILKYPNLNNNKKRNTLKNEINLDSEYNLLRSKESRKREYRGYQHHDRGSTTSLNFQKKYHGKFKSDY